MVVIVVMVEEARWNEQGVETVTNGKRRARAGRQQGVCVCEVVDAWLGGTGGEPRT